LSDVGAPAVTPQTVEENAGTTNPMVEPADPRSTTSGLHDVVKSTDFWFNYELSLLEKYAVTSAVQWAQAGIPRQDAPAEGELPVETPLKARASEIFQGWIARIKRKVQDSIQAASADAGSRIVQFRHAIAQRERTAIEISTTEQNPFDREEGLRNVAGAPEWRRLLCPCPPGNPHKFKFRETTRLHVFSQDESERTHFLRPKNKRTSRQSGFRQGRSSRNEKPVLLV
jgi:hypothetical protein